VCVLRRRRVLYAHPVRAWAAACGPAPRVLDRVGPSRPILWLGLAGRVHDVRSRATLSFGLMAV
jgi:hypothetical protein